MSARDGFVIVDKPEGVTSHDVVATLRRRLGTRRIGHGGTLDPLATGVLVMGVGRGTRLLRWVSGGDKRYQAIVHVGSSTTTDDAAGDVIHQCSPEALNAVTDEMLAATVQRFQGVIRQRPSSVSAIKVQGVRAHARVRAGEHVELAAREVVIHDLTWNVARRDSEGIDLVLDVTCSSGTYIRALARDIGEELRTGAHVQALRRTFVGDFGLTEARDPDDVVSDSVIDLAAAARRILPATFVDEESSAAMVHGRPLAWPCETTATHAFLTVRGDLLAVGDERDGLIDYQCVFA